MGEKIIVFGRTFRIFLALMALSLGTLIISARNSTTLILYVKRAIRIGSGMTPSQTGSAHTQSVKSETPTSPLAHITKTLSPVAPRDLKVETKIVASSAGQVTLGVDYEAIGTEFGLSFSVNFNRNHLSYVSSSVGATGGWTVLTNSSAASSSGNLTYALSGDINTLTPLSSGVIRILSITFNILPAAKCGVASPVTLSGVPSAIMVADATGSLLSAPTAIPGGVTVTPNPITFVGSSTLTMGLLGSSFSQNILASGGSGTFSSYTITGGTLPAGLTLTANGYLSGTPTSAGTFSFNITAYDSNGCTGSQYFTLSISCPTVSVIPASLPAATQFTPYPAQTITLSGSSAPLTWSLSSGSLPAGLTLNSSTGVISGTPIVNGIFNFTISGVFGYDCTASKAYNLTVGCPTIILSAILNPTAGVSYNGSVAVTAPAGNFTYAVTSGSLPSGLFISSTTGAITGIPTSTGSATFTITATGLGNCIGSKTYILLIECPTVTVEPVNLPIAITKLTYSQPILAIPAGAYQYAVTSGSLPPGLTLDSSNGLVSGVPTIPGIYNFSVTVTGWGGCAGVSSTSINVIETNVPPITGNPSNPLLPTPNLGPGSVVTLSQTLTNNINFSFNTTFSATLSSGLTAVPGGCSVPYGNCTIGQATTFSTNGSSDHLNRKQSLLNVAAAQTITWSGTIPANSSLKITYLVQVSTQAVSGTQYCITTTLGGSTGPSSCLTVTVPPSGPGSVISASGVSSAQKPGSILIYNFYNSSAGSAQSDTRIAITNTNIVNPVLVHLFLVDGSNCSVAAQYIELTQRQTASFLLSDIDPGVSGYIIAVATDKYGCPIIQNDLIGDSFVKLESGHQAGLPAIGVSGVSTGPQICNPESLTITIAFNGTYYNVLPRTLAVDSLLASSTGNQTMLIVNHIGGNMVTGAALLGTISGLLFDDMESSQSYSLPGGTCQLRGILGNNFPRTAPRYTSVIPAGRTGWMKFWTINDQAITGAVINESSSGFSGGHNLHQLTTTTSGSLTIPVFPPR